MVQKEVIQAIAEFIGTAHFLFMGLGGSDAIAALAGPGSDGVTLLATAFSFGWSLMINVWLWAEVSGGVLNPAITIALVAIGEFETLQGIYYIIAQFAGALVGSLLIQLIQPVPVAAITTLGSGTSVIQGFIMEMITTSILTLAVLVLAIEKQGKFNAAFGIGSSLFISVLVAGPYTGAR
ncbi:11765_t:CDS:2 [Funneliformis geosporum]|nr:11765_t:CDS:2 [Funneliformis geosporum]